MQIGFLGAGRLAQALARGFIASGIAGPEHLIASSPKEDIKYLNEIAEIGCSITHDNIAVVRQSEVVLVAVKPPVVTQVLSEVAPYVTPRHLFISCALGVPLHRLQQELPLASRVVRVMPNTPALVQEGASVFSCGPAAHDGDREVTRRLFSSVGLCEEAPETLLDAVTGLSGSGPAYIYVAIEALADGGVKMGLPRHLSLKLAAQTFKGAAEMVLATGRHPGDLKDDVCSPAGSSIHGLYELERSGLRAALMDAVQSATTCASGKRSREDKT